MQTRKEGVETVKETETIDYTRVTMLFILLMNQASKTGHQKSKTSIVKVLTARTNFNLYSGSQLYERVSSKSLLRPTFEEKPAI